MRWIENVVQDLRYALRGLRRRPGFALAVIVTLGLGVGGNATMFGIVDRLLFRPPAYLIGPDRAHRLYFARFVNGTQRVGQSFQYQRYLDLSRSSSTMDVLAAYGAMTFAAGSGEATREIRVGAANASLWQLFDAHPVIGRFFGADDDRAANDARVVVLSYGYWQSHYAASPTVLGTTITIGPSPYRVIGVAPRGFAGVQLQTPDVFIPLEMAGSDGRGPERAYLRTSYDYSWLEVYGRRKSGVSIEAATADLTRAFRESYLKQIAAEPRTSPIGIAKPNVVLGSVLFKRGPRRSADARVAIWLLGVTGIVLLIACANVGNLLLARALSRRHEIALRVALGVSRARLVGQLLIESTVLALLGAVAGLMLAQWVGQSLRTFLLPSVEWPNALTDHRVVLFASLAAVTAGVFAGVAPVIQATRSDVITGLKTSARDGTAGRSRLRSGLMLAQVALSVMLLIGAGLFVQSVARVSRLHLGYDADQLLLVEAHLRGSNMDSTQRAALRRALLERASTSADIESATSLCSAPFYFTCAADVFVAGVDSTNRLGEFVRQPSSPAYFKTTGTRLLRGRGFSSADRAGAPLVIIVSDGMARALWPTEDAIGNCVRIRSGTSPCRTVVGVAESERLANLGDDASLVFYIPDAQTADPEWRDPQKVRLYVRVRGAAAAHGEAVRRDLQAVLPGSIYLVVQPMMSVLAPVTRSWRLGATLFAAFGALALTLAAIGLYSVVAYGVAQRTHEIGVRVALGARVADVMALVVRDALRAVVVGLVIGMCFALAAGRWLGPLLFRVSPRDPLVFAAVTAALLGVALAASCLPAIRASRVDPAIALRSD